MKSSKQRVFPIKMPGPQKKRKQRPMLPNDATFGKIPDEAKQDRILDKIGLSGVSGLLDEWGGSGFNVSLRPIEII